MASGEHLVLQMRLSVCMRRHSLRTVGAFKVAIVGR